MEEGQTKPKGVIRIFFRDNTFKSLAITSATTASDVCTSFASKMKIHGHHFHLFQVLDGKDRPIESNERPLLLQIELLAKNSNWGSSKNCGFRCSFSEASVRLLKKRILVSQKRITSTFFNAPLKPGAAVSNKGEDQHPQQHISRLVVSQSAASPPKKHLEQESLRMRSGSASAPASPKHADREEPRVHWNIDSLQIREKRQAADDLLLKELADMKFSLQNDTVKPFNRARHFSTPVARGTSFHSLGTLPSFTMEEISNWLQDNGLGEYCRKFEEQAIDGAGILMLTEEDFKELGVKIGHRKKMVSLLEKHKPRSNSLLSKSGSKTNLSVEGVEVGSWNAPETSEDEDLDQLIMHLSGLTALHTIAESDAAQVDSFLALIAKKLDGHEGLT
eukprot:TRINITY_DN5183_c0_g2_i1.p1 TRINITY_DN5183_c0_g2~~TRINITY_DN5183_c0_g2_i1.p1  ORF type:complete len:400 (+),score=58.75 TRINITY_DN5183_c0_g2_i1:30-1202(+)